MKFSLGLFALAAIQLVSAAPGADGTLWKRASRTDKANIGYATLNGGTTGGGSGPVTTVNSLSALKTAVSGNSAAIVIVSGTITGNEVVKVGANKSVLGASGASLVGVGLRVIEVNNVIIRNLKISKVLASAGDAIGIQEANNVWIDHVTVSSDRSHEKDYYDGLIDITHGCQYVTVSWSVLRDHWKGSLVGHSDSNSSEDTKITVTYASNYWTNLNSRLPSFRFGHGHIFNNYFENSNDGINTRVGAQLLIENNVFSGVSNAVYSTTGGYAVLKGNDLGGSTNTAPAGSFTSAPYSYSLAATSSVKSAVLAGAGANLSF